MKKRDVLLTLIDKNLYVLTDEITPNECVYFINDKPVLAEMGDLLGHPITAIKWVLAYPKQIAYVNRGSVLESPDRVTITPLHEGDVHHIFEKNGMCTIEVQANNEPVYLDGKVIIFLP